MILLLLAAALAQDPADDTPSESEDHVSEEIDVYGEIMVARARKRVERRLEDGGYTNVIDKGDKVIYRHPAAWKGEVVLHDDGWVEVRRQQPRVEGREWNFAERNSAAAWMMCTLTPWRCVRLGGIMVSKKKFRAQEGKAVQGIHNAVEEWGEAIADHAVERKVFELPERLELLWNDGIPLEGTEELTTPAERKQALLDYWESRTDSRWGEEVRGTLEAFIRHEVQQSDHPFTEAEIEAFNLRSTAWRPLTLERPGGPAGSGTPPSEAPSEDTPSPDVLAIPVDER